MFRATHQPKRYRHRGQGELWAIIVGGLFAVAVVAYVGYGVLGIGKPAVVNNPSPPVGMCGDKPCVNNFHPDPNHEVPVPDLSRTYIKLRPRLTFPASPGPPNFVDKPYTTDVDEFDVQEPGLTIAECQAQIPTAEESYRGTVAPGVTVVFTQAECLDPQ